MDGWLSGVYAEAVQGLKLVDVNVTFVKAHAQASVRPCFTAPPRVTSPPLPPQSYWGTKCVNTSAAGFPVTTQGGSCTPPPLLSDRK